MGVPIPCYRNSAPRRARVLLCGELRKPRRLDGRRQLFVQGARAERAASAPACARKEEQAASSRPNPGRCLTPSLA
jgi:hypothetical protein